MTKSPQFEEHIELSDNEFGFGVEYLKPLIEVSFNKDNSGKDLRLHTKGLVDMHGKFASTNNKYVSSNIKALRWFFWHSFSKD